MKINERETPRQFVVGNKTHIVLSDCGSVSLEPDEQLTFVTDSGTEYDVVRKSWGYYATPSLNGRLARYNLRAVLVKSSVTSTYFIMLVEKGLEEEFMTYLASEDQRIITWLDSDDSLEKLEQKLHHDV